MNKAPWKDYEGNDIYDGNTIIHPSGQRGVVVFHRGRDGATNQWVVNYGDIESRLFLQIQDKGRGVVSKHDWVSVDEAMEWQKQADENIAYLKKPRIKFYSDGSPFSEVDAKNYYSVGSDCAINEIVKSYYAGPAKLYL